MIARDDVVEIQLTFGEAFPAILAGVLIAKEDVFSRKFHFLARDAIVDGEDDDLRNLQRDADRMDHLFGHGALRVFEPRADIVCLVASFTFSLDDLCVA